MSDRIAVFNEGRIEQIGTPAEMYEHPRTEFVAGFIGTSNVLERGGRRFTVGQRRSACCRPRRAEGEPGVVRAAVYLGAATRFIVELDGGGELVALQQNLEVSSSDVTCNGGPARPPRVAAGRGVHDQGGEVRKRIRVWHARARRPRRRARRAGGWRRRRARRMRSRRRSARARARSASSSGRALHGPELREEVRAADGLQDQAQGRRLVERDVQHHARRRRRRRRSVRPRLGIRRREPAADLRRRRRARERQPDPVWKNFLPAFKSPPHNTVKGVHYGVSLQWGPNTLIYNTKKVKPAPTSWSAIYSPKYKGKITVPNNPIQIADAALYLQKTKPVARDQGPVRADEAAVQRGGLAAQEAEAAAKRYWVYAGRQHQGLQDGRLRHRCDMAVSDAAAAGGARCPSRRSSRRRASRAGRTRGCSRSEAPHPNCAYKWMAYAATPQVQAQQALVFGETPVNPKACPFMDKIQKGSCARYHLNAPASYAKSIRFWKTPDRGLRLGRTQRLHGPYRRGTTPGRRSPASTLGGRRVHARRAPCGGPASASRRSSGGGRG